MRSLHKDGMHSKNKHRFIITAYPIALLLSTVLCITACHTTKSTYNPSRKIPPAALQEDYSVFRSTLEYYHPGLYWFTSKDSMDHYFNWGFQQLNDSLNESRFRNILTVVANKIRCGHTTVRSSRAFDRYFDTAATKIFPLSLKVWSDSMVVVANLDREDSLLKPGTVITGIDGHSARKVIDTLMHYVNSDGHSLNARYQLLSNMGSFGSLYRSVYGTRERFSISYKTPDGDIRSTDLSAFDPTTDSSGKKRKNINTAPNRLDPTRNLQVDTSLSSAYMVLNSFRHGHRLRHFFKSSFHLMRKLDVQHLVIDVRANGGGDVGLARILTSYLVKQPFRLADTLYSRGLKGSPKRHLRFFPAYQAMLFWVSRKKNDGLRHFGYFERHEFKPRKKDHFNGSIYFITGGNSFSATTLVLRQLHQQPNVVVVGEETGGGAYGNSAWMIPEVTLPHSRIRYRLPLFRLVMNKEALAAGRGILPDIWVAATAVTIQKGIDVKSEKVRELILYKNNTGTGH